MKLLAYNLLYQYRQIANPNGSFPPWVCRMYPYVVDHPELRWGHRFPAIAATLERENADVLGLSEMRGGLEVSTDRGRADPSPDPAHGPPVIRDITHWMRDDFEFRYRWISVWTLEPDAIEHDPAEERAWVESDCRPDMSSQGCAHYDVGADHYSTKSYLAYRPDRFSVAEAGAFEIPSSSPQERRFAPWARLVPLRGGPALLVIVVHLDPMSEEHRLSAIRRIRSFVANRADVAVAVLGDFNVDAGTDAHGMLTGGGGRPLVDAIALHGRGEPTRGTSLRFRLRDPRARWRSEEPCWPTTLAGEGRRHLPDVDVEETGRRTDYIFVTPDVTVLDAQIVTPVARTIMLGRQRPVHPSDHLPVIARIRVGGSGG